MNKQELTQLILSKLKGLGGCAYVRELADALNVDENNVALTLSWLAKQGLVYRDEQSTLDYTKPLLTSKWCLKEAPKYVNAVEPVLGQVIEVILSPSILKDLGDRLKEETAVGLLDALYLYICNAKRSIKIAMPYIGESLGVLVMECINDIRSVDVKIITEEDSRKNVEPLKRYIPKLEVRYATKYESRVKIRGIHAKFIVIDDGTAILGTFNLTGYHLFVNYDLGVVIKGPVASFLSKLFDQLWENLGKDQGGVISY